jgi:tetratricopeptide (TPR) repeat protein
LLSGSYAECVALAERGLKSARRDVEWRLLQVQAMLALGRYGEARTAITNALARESESIVLRWLAREIFLANGQTDRAAEMSAEIIRLVSTRPWNYRDPLSLIVFGKAALQQGADAKQVLDRLFETARKADPKLREAYLASGELALEKHDFALAAKSFTEGLKYLPEDPDLHYGLARAYAPSDRAQMLASLEAALERNPQHLPSLLLLADHRIDAEDYAGARAMLEKVRTVNPWHPEAWAYEAVLANLEGNSAQEQAGRLNALRFWPTNPRVDHLIGRKLSQEYRFAEGATHQRAALQMDPDYLPAKAQLAQDLLRLGEEAEGWRLAKDVLERDAYDITANNLVTLCETMAKFQTLSNEHFTVRMHPREAALCGSRVLELLERARTTLCPKYEMELAHPVLVELFAEQKDFAVRTFGLPEHHGYLGVCFGRVITANSPAARPGHPFNWESMLWHEFCHVVTLQVTRNKMPRWLSEGISVYEERQANPAWGERLTPRYREMLLSDDLTPVSKLSAAFLSPKSEVHLQFAYYESSLAVQLLVEHFGREKLAAILRDLGDGMEINRALTKQIGPLAQLEKDFAAYARQTAEQLAPGLDWKKPAFKVMLPEAGEVVQTAWTKAHPTNFWVMTHQARQLMDQKQWAEAKPVLQRLVEFYPDFTGPESAYRLLAEAHRALGETNAEQQVLARFAERDGSSPDAYLRLMELASAAQDWPAVIQNAQRYLAVNPLVPAPYRFLAQAGEQTGQTRMTIDAYRALLQLDPPDPAHVHFHLAEQLHRTHDPDARRHLLQALEEAPRYRAALRLLLEMNGEPSCAQEPTAASAPTPNP